MLLCLFYRKPIIKRLFKSTTNKNIPQMMRHFAASKSLISFCFNGIFHHSLYKRILMKKTGCKFYRQILHSFYVPDIKD